jgi:hypothetical protein
MQSFITYQQYTNKFNPVKFPHKQTKVSQKQTNSTSVFYTKIHPVTKGNTIKTKSKCHLQCIQQMENPCIINHHGTCMCGVVLVAGPVRGMSTQLPPPPTPQAV